VLRVTSATFDITTKQVPSTTVVTITGTADRVGFESADIEHCTQGPGVRPPDSIASDIIWIDDNLPAGMTLGGANWNNTHHASGTRSLTLPSSNSYQQYQLLTASTPFIVNDSEVAVCIRASKRMRADAGDHDWLSHHDRSGKRCTSARRSSAAK